MITYIPSPQQAAYFRWIEAGRGSCFLEAVAGAGKTTTLVQGVRRILSGTDRRLSISAAMYNKQAATDFQAKLAEAGISPDECRAGTFHSFGFSAWRRVHPKVLVDERAKWDQVRGDLKIPDPLQTFVKNLLSLAKQEGIGAVINAADKQHWWDMVEHHDLADGLEDPERDALEGIRWAYRALKLSRDIAGTVIDYDDMIYMPIATQCRVWQNDWLLGDEMQDSNPARRALARRMLSPGGRAAFVGDRHQAIYGFAGADAASVDAIIQEFGCTELPLTITYRCPKAVVREARAVVSHIEAHESAPEGVVRRIEAEEFMDERLTAADAVLCRNTAPLVALAFKLIKARVPCHVEGRAIGDGLKRLLGRWRTNNLSVLRDALATYQEKRTAKLMAEKKETSADQLADQCDTLRALMDGASDVAGVRTAIDGMFQDNTPTLTLCTCHRSKGREWERVYLWGANAYMPSAYARQDWQLEQEDNLLYVALTRSKHELVKVWVKVEKREGGR